MGNPTNALYKPLGNTAENDEDGDPGGDLDDENDN